MGWGFLKINNINNIIKLQKRAIRIIDKARYRESTNPLLVGSCISKSLDIVYLKTLELLFRVRNKSLPICIQHFFKLREGNYNLRGLCIFDICKMRTNVKFRCLSFGSQPME